MQVVVQMSEYSLHQNFVDDWGANQTRYKPESEYLPICQKAHIATEVESCVEYFKGCHCLFKLVPNIKTFGNSRYQRIETRDSLVLSLSSNKTELIAKYLSELSLLPFFVVVFPVLNFALNIHLRAFLSVFLNEVG